MLYSRWTSFVCFLICVGLLAFAAYLQLNLGLLPCPLCVVQRLFIALLGITFLFGSLYTPVEKFGRHFHSGLIILFSGLGALVAARHVWLTMQPAGSVPTCSPTLEYMLQNLPLNQTLQLLLQGSGDCARATWQLFGFNIPQWTLAFFVAFGLFGIVRFMSIKDDKKR